MRQTAERQVSFADAELQRQVRLDTTLQGISDLLDQQAQLVEMVHQDLVRGLKNPQAGRKGIGAEQALRCFVLKGMKNWDLRELGRADRRWLQPTDLHELLRPPGPQARRLQPL